MQLNPLNKDCLGANAISIKYPTVQIKHLTLI